MKGKETILQKKNHIWIFDTEQKVLVYYLIWLQLILIFGKKRIKLAVIKKKLTTWLYEWKKENFKWMYT